ncbi:MAG: 50S ribosomal protein L29 [Bacteroidota bacterium]
MKAFELKELSDQELEKRLIDEEENLAHLRFQHATAQLETPAKLRTVRKDIARMKTMLRERAHKAEREATKALKDTQQEEPIPQSER